MDYKKVTDQFAVAPQISPEDVAKIKSLGYVAIINNRPDGEAADQPQNNEIESMARAAGLEYHHLPIISGTMSAEAIDETKALLQNIDGPIFAFCRTGTRSITLWALSQKGQGNREDVISAVKEAGYDLPFLAQFL